MISTQTKNAGWSNRNRFHQVMCSCWPRLRVEIGRDCPDDSQIGVNIRAFSAFLQDSHEVTTAT